jgi:hypothetical protein
VVVVLVEVVVVEVELDGAGYVAMSDPSPIDISVRDPVLAAGVWLLAPERLATQRSLPDTAKAESRLK